MPYLSNVLTRHVAWPLAGLLFTMVVACSARANINDLILPVAFTGETTHSFSVFSSGPTAIDSLGATFDPFTADLGQFDRIVLELLLPDDQRFVVTPPAGGDTSLSYVVNYFVAGTGGGATDANAAATAVFIEAEGDAPDLSAFGSTRQAGNQIFLGASADVAAPFSFRGLRIELPGTPGFGSSFVSQSFTDLNSSFEFTFNDPTFSNFDDPGPFVVIVPEPATAALIGLGVFAAVGRRRPH